MIGCLREKGLLIVGRKMILNKRYKVVVVPVEMRAELDILAYAKKRQYKFRFQYV